MNKKFTNPIQISLIVFLFLLVSPQSFPQLANGYDKFLGNVHSGSSTTPAYWDTYWNQVTPENASKWASVEGSRDNFSWGGADNAYNYAKQRGIPFKWHTLVWGQQSPGWISALSPEEQLEEIVELFSAVGQRYPEIDYIDVVNEALNGHNPPDGGNGRANFKAGLGGNGTTGWDWVIKAFELARQYMPNSKLILNDYGIINDNNATTNYLRIIRLLKDRGLIDGIGVQGHRFELMNAASSTLQRNMDSLWATGIPIYISELDLGPDENSQPNEALQLSAYQRIFPLLWEHPGLKCITLWGYVQGQMWQPNCYLLRSNGTETPAMEWLRQYLTKSGSYRTFQSGNWNDVNSWEQYDDSVWVHPVTGAPSLGSEVITIQNGHTINVTQQDSADQVIVAAGGTLVINPGVNFLVKNGAGTDLTVNGTLKNFGTISKDDSAEIIFAGSGKYQHEQDGGVVPIAEWRQNSIIQFDSLKTTAPSNANQDFYNVVWNCPNQTVNLNLGWNGNTISGNITIRSTGTGGWQMCAPAVNTSATVTINGDIIQTGGNFTTNGTSNPGTTITINHSGDINVTGGNFSISGGSQGGTGTTVWNLTGGNFSMSNATTQNSNSAGAKFVFRGQGTQSMTLGSGNTLTSLPIEVMSGATLNIGTSELGGSGIFTLNAGATLESGHADGIEGNLKNTGTKTLSAEAGYGFSGTTAQVTGSLIPDAVENLIINNSAGVTLSKTVTVNGMLDIGKSGFSVGGNQLIYGALVTLRYSGTTAMTTGDVEFPLTGGPENLSITNTSSTGITLHQTRTIPGKLELSGKLRLVDNDLTVSEASSSGSTRFVVTNGTGSLKIPNIGTTEMLYPVGITSYSPVWITNTGTTDLIGVRVESDAEPVPEGGRIRVKWHISEGTEGGGNYRLQFGWVTTLEQAAFREPSREDNAFIFNLIDTTEAGEGEYTMQFTTQPYTISRGGITTLGPFAVGKFKSVTEVNEEKEGIPIKFTLSQNFPNPFNPVTIIRYSISEPSKTKVIIYNVLGVKVRTLIDSFQNAGEHSIDWNAMDDNYNPVASGVYFYSLEAGDKRLQKKMILIR